MSSDVAVVGGGPAGALAALVLARAGRQVVLIDAAPSARKLGESLPAIAGHLLRSLGLGAVLDVHRPSFGNVSAWGSADLVATDFVNDPHGLGWHLDRARFDADLRSAAADAGADLRSARVRAAEPGWVLRLSDGTTALAACVLDATGRRASIARGQGAKRTCDDAMVAVYAWAPDRSASAAADADAAGERTLVEAARDGWWYTAPLPRGERVIALHVDASNARHVARSFAGASEPRGRAADFVPITSSAEFGAPHVARAIAGANLLGRPHVTEACGARLDAFVGRGWVATGDAALSFDPIAAQGIFNALYTGMKAGEAIAAALEGDPLPLTAYSRRLEEIRAVYLERHRHVYALETRFRDAPFWRGR